MLVVRADGSDSHYLPLVRGFGKAQLQSDAEWSPDSKSVAFVLDSSNELAPLFVASADGRGAPFRISGKGVVESYAWRPVASIN